MGENDSREIPAGYNDEKIVFVVTHQDVVFGTERFYQVRLFYQRLYLGFGSYSGKTHGFLKKPFRTRLALCFFSEIKGEARLEVSGFADIKHAAEAVAEYVYAGMLGYIFRLLHSHLCSGFPYYTLTLVPVLLQ